MKCRLFSCALGVVVGNFIANAQFSIVEVDSRLANELPFAAVSTRFTAVVVALGFAAPEVRLTKCRIVSQGVNSDYDLRTKSGDWSCTIDAVTGQVKSLINLKRREDQYKRRGRTGAQFFSSEQAARSHLRQIATKCGVPGADTFSSLVWKRDGEVQDGNSAGAIWANYRIPGRESFQVEVDPQDGTFISFRHAIKR